MQKKSVYLSFILASMTAGVLAGLILDMVSEPLALTDIGIFVFSIPISSVLLLLFAAPVAIALHNVTRALTHLSENKSAKPIDPLPFNLLAPLIRVVNALISNQQEFQMARGRLYEQISEVAAQEERKRLARDLHDSIKQQVFSISISAAAAHAHLETNPTAARDALIDVKQSAQEAMVEMRALLQQLSPTPLEKSGLVEALREQCEALSYRTGARVQTHFGELPSDAQLPPGTQAVIFRIAQEALSNIARHARAQHVTLKLSTTSEDQLVLQIEDDGQGFDVVTVDSGMGLNNMQNRAESIHATFKLSSQRGKGTHLNVRVPLIKPEPEENLMYEQTESQRKELVTQYWLIAGSVAAIIFAATLLLSRIIQQPAEFVPDPVMGIILVGLVVTLIIAVPMAIIFSRRAWRDTRTYEDLVRHDKRSIFWVRRHWHMAQIIIGVACAWILPILAIRETISPLVPIAIALLFVAVIGWNYLQMHNLYRAEIAFMSAAERVAEMDLRLAEVRRSWLTIGFLIFVQVVSVSLADDFQFPPVTQDNWMTLSLITVTVLLLLNQFISVWVYRGWRRDAMQEQVAA